MDEEERSRMAEAGVSSEEYNQFLQVLHGLMCIVRANSKQLYEIILYVYIYRKLGNFFFFLLKQPSSNVDDSGYFSVQVLSAALSVWGLELLPFNSSDPRAAAARHCPM